MSQSNIVLRLTAMLALIVPAIAVAADVPPLPQGLTAPSAATRLPAFSLPTAAGGTINADEYKGKVIIARFWATW